MRIVGGETGFSHWDIPVSKKSRTDFVHGPGPVDQGLVAEA
jgi:hypothetical protein